MADQFVSGRDFQIRLAQVNECEALSKIATEAANKFIVGELTVEGREKLLSSLGPASIANDFAAGIMFWVAEQNGRFLGYVAMKPPAHLYHLYVDEAFHGRGVGKALFAEAIRIWSQTHSFDNLTVNASRYAVPIYEKWGFFPTEGLVDRCGVICFPMVKQIAEESRSVE